MNKIMTLFKREYRAAVRTKSFIISLVLVPILMGGGFLAMIIMEKQKDTDDKQFVIIDHSGRMEEPFLQAMEERNRREIFNPETGEKVAAAFMIEFEDADTADLPSRMLALSNRIKSGELHAFIEIGPDILHPSAGSASYLRYYTEHAFNDEHRGWFRNVLNNNLQKMRVAELNLPQEVTGDLFHYIFEESMGLVTVDKKTGEQQEAERANELQVFLVPYILLLLMFMLVMMSALPLLTTVMEEKNERIAEVLLGSITPFQFMMGKVLGGIGVSLTIAGIYVAAGIFTARFTGVESVIPYDVLP
ncbi:MAG: ABC transporter permease, partial [Bacteroidetes bacterium]